MNINYHFRSDNHEEQTIAQAMKRIINHCEERLHPQIKFIYLRVKQSESDPKRGLYLHGFVSWANSCSQSDCAKRLRIQKGFVEAQKDNSFCNIQSIMLSGEALKSFKDKALKDMKTIYSYGSLCEEQGDNIIELFSQRVLNGDNDNSDTDHISSSSQENNNEYPDNIRDKYKSLFPIHNNLNNSNISLDTDKSSNYNRVTHVSTNLLSLDNNHEEHIHSNNTHDDCTSLSVALPIKKDKVIDNLEKVREYIDEHKAMVKLNKLSLNFIFSDRIRQAISYTMTKRSLIRSITNKCLVLHGITTVDKS